MEEEEPVPDDLRCKRTDGRDWRCKRRAVDGKSYCQSHLSRGQRKQQPPPPPPPNPDPNPKPKPRVRIRLPPIKPKPEPLDEPDPLPVLPLNPDPTPTPGPLPDALRCTRNDGRSWRCKKQAVAGQSLCETHLQKAQAQAQSKKRPKKGDDVIPVPDTQRCGRNNGKDWRCKRKAKGGHSLCESHSKNLTPKPKMENPEPKPEPKPKPNPKPKKKEDNVIEDDDVRCKRTDGRGWRCKRKVLEGKTLCEIHYEQGRLRQMRVTVPESLKIQRGTPGGAEKVEKRLKRKRALEALENSSDNKGMKRMKAELIRVFLRREIIERSKKSDNSKSSSGGEEEVTRDLPYGLMAIPPAPPNHFLDNAAGIKVGVQCLKSTVNRRFRSKNIEPPPVGPLKVVPYVGDMGKVKGNGRKKCHWCRGGENQTLTKCLSCRKRFFCSDCIKERRNDPEEVKQKCPVCAGSCDCKACLSTQTKDKGIKEPAKEKFKGSKFQHLQYLINYLLPVLVRINQEQSVEVEMEAKLKGQNLSEVEIRQADVGCGDRCCCNNCKSPILDFHRSCPNCSYNLCLSCCREYSQHGSLGGVKSSSFDHHSEATGLNKCSKKIQPSTCPQTEGGTELALSAPLSDSTACLLSCPPMELGGCDNSLLDLRCIFPLNWTKELEISAKEMSSECSDMQTTDDSAHCVLCSDISQEADKNKELQEASRRRDSVDNFLYCPSIADDHDSLLAHFQKHWRKGHPVKVRNVLQGASNLSWDPLSMFCSYLEKGSSICENVREAVEAANCSDWYDVEIGNKESFIGSLGEGYKHKKRETLKVKAKFCSALSRRLFEGHYGEIIHYLPLQEYTNPRSGLLNLAGKLPEDFPDFKLGPQVCISCGSREEVARGELVTRLHYNAYDVVNILVHVSDASCSTEQINKIKKLIRRNNAKDEGGYTSQNVENEETRMHSEISGEAGEQDRFVEGTSLNQGAPGASSSSAATNGVSGVNLRDDKSPAKVHCSDTDSDASMICSGTSDSPEKSVDQTYVLDRVESSSFPDKRHVPVPCGSQWDVFRRQDVPKLLEYILNHVDELSCGYVLSNNLVHPIFDGSFYLDAIHKMRLKEEFGIEPWTFNQCLGEAVFVPAGCPYQIRTVKSCVNIALGFVSPEHTTECIKLMDEIRVLPNNHKAKQNKLEVEKMTICTIDEAIKEMYRLRSENAGILT